MFLQLWVEEVFQSFSELEDKRQARSAIFLELDRYPDKQYHENSVQLHLSNYAINELSYLFYIPQWVFFDKQKKYLQLAAACIIEQSFVTVYHTQIKSFYSYHTFVLNFQ